MSYYSIYLCSDQACSLLSSDTYLQSRSWAMDVKLNVDAELAWCLVVLHTYIIYVSRIVTKLNCAYSAVMKIMCACNLRGVSRGKKWDKNV